MSDGEAQTTRTLSVAQASLVRKLKRRKERDRTGLFVAEGVRCAREALRAGLPVRLAVVAPRLSVVPDGAGLEESLRSGVGSVATVSDRELEALSDTMTPQGVLLLCERKTTALDSFPDGARLLVMDGIQDPGNVGTLIRSAHAFGLDGTVALAGTADPWGAKALRASAGSVFHVPVASAGREEFTSWAGGRDVGLMVAEAGADLRESGEGPDLTDGWALVVGNEGAGVSAELRAAATVRVGIPIDGAESLNAGVAGSILMYEYTKGSGGRT